jgi:hypothetical protein
VHWSNSIYELIVSSVPCSGYYGLVSSILASICNQVNKALSVGDVHAEQQQRAWEKATSAGGFLAQALYGLALVISVMGCYMSLSVSISRRGAPFPFHRLFSVIVDPFLRSFVEKTHVKQ